MIGRCAVVVLHYFNDRSACVVRPLFGHLIYLYSYFFVDFSEIVRNVFSGGRNAIYVTQILTDAVLRGSGSRY